MNKIQKVGIAMAVACSMSFADDPMWTADGYAGIVAFPWVVECMTGPDFDETDPDDPCYKDQGGWWFGYVTNKSTPGQTRSDCKDGYNRDGEKSSTTNKVEAKIGGQWITFIGPDNDNCEGPPITDIENGESLLEDGFLEVNLLAEGGDRRPDDEVYDVSMAALAVNLSGDGTVDRDIDALGYGGICLTYETDYEANGPADREFEQGLQLELGWNEDLGGGTKLEEDEVYDIWYAEIPGSTEKITKKFAWASDLSQENAAARYSPNFSGDFRQDNYSAQLRPLSKAVKEMRAVKIRIKQYANIGTVNFKLHAFSFAPKSGPCPEVGGTPIISKGAVPKTNLGLSLSGKMLSINNLSKPAPVQVINLYGAVVQSQVYTPGTKMNLNNLPTGVYMVRVPSSGYTGKIMVK